MYVWPKDPLAIYFNDGRNDATIISHGQTGNGGGVYRGGLMQLLQQLLLCVQHFNAATPAGGILCSHVWVYDIVNPLQAHILTGFLT